MLCGMRQATTRDVEVIAKDGKILAAVHAEEVESLKPFFVLGASGGAQACASELHLCHHLLQLLLVQVDGEQQKPGVKEDGCSRAAAT